MTLLIQPAGSRLCGYYAVMNAHLRLGFEAPDLNRLRHGLHLQPEVADGGLSAHHIGWLLDQLGWRAIRYHFPYTGQPEAVVRGLMAGGATVILNHTLFAPAESRGHWVVADFPAKDGLAVACSLDGRSVVPWRMNTGLDGGFDWDAVAAWPPTRDVGSSP